MFSLNSILVYFKSSAEISSSPLALLLDIFESANCTSPGVIGDERGFGCPIKDEIFGTFSLKKWF